MARHTLVGLICLLLCSRVTLAQDTIIFGRAIGSNHVNGVPSTWAVHVTAKVAGVNIPVKGDSEHELYVIRVPRNASVTLIWETIGYEGKQKIINTNDKDKQEAYRQDVSLSQILREKKVVDMPSKAQMRQRIADAVNMAKDTQSYDILAYNMSAYKTAYPEYKDDVDAAKTSLLKSPDLSSTARLALGGDAENWYKHIILTSASIDLGVDPSWDKWDTTKDAWTFPGIKNGAFVYAAKISYRLDATQKGHLDTWLKAYCDDPGSKYRIAALGVMAKGGDAKARYQFLLYLNGTDPDDALVAVQSIGSYQIPGTQEALSKTIEQGATPEIRSVAIQSQRKLGKAGDATIDLLIRTLDHDKSALVRAEAVKSLFEVADNNKVQAVLKAVAANDPSPEVRESARLKISK